MSEGTKSDRGSTRWWEFYVVRYAMGTIAGGIIVLMLSSAIPSVQSMFFVCASNTASAKAPTAAPTVPTLPMDRLPLLALCGLVYCYVASAPILVFHAGRFALAPKGDRKTLNRMDKALAGAVVVVLAAVLLATLLSNEKRGWLAISAFGVVAALQAAVALLTVCKSSCAYAFYKKLSKARDKDSGELVESYRHLREHGNSFFILFLEAVLGVALIWANHEWSRDPLPALLLMLLIWIIPAVSVWVIATLFEREFSSDPQEAEPKTASSFLLVAAQAEDPSQTKTA